MIGRRRRRRREEINPNHKSSFLRKPENQIDIIIFI